MKNVMNYLKMCLIWAGLYIYGRSMYLSGYITADIMNDLSDDVSK